MKQFFLLPTLLLLSLPLFSQNYDWEKKREITTTRDSAYNVIYVLYYQQYDYQYEKDDLVMFDTVHKIIKVNNDKAISSNNRIYIPVGGPRELVEVKARTLAPDGTQQLLDQNEIKEIEDEEAGKGYRIFAIEGAVVGGEIEYLYKIKMPARYFGLNYFQFDSPVKEAGIKLTSPENLEFAFKSYNGFPKVKETQDDENRNIYMIAAENIPALEEEPFSIYDEHRQKVAFKLNFNTARGRVKLFTWENVGKTIFERTYSIDRKEEKTVKDILKRIKAPDELKAAAIEDYVKTNYFLEKNAGYQTQNIEFIDENKFSNEFGLTRLMVNLYKAAGFKPQIILTSDRTMFKLDTDFESYNYLTDYLIYLPSVGKYIAPYNHEDRLNLTPSQFTANEAIFIKTVELQGEKYPIVEIGYIDAPSSDKNHDNMDVKVSFSDNLSTNQIVLNRSFKGYQASYIKAIMPHLQENEKKELLKSLVKFMSADANIDEMRFLNEDFNYKNWEEPLELVSTFEAESFIERAGPTLLFKLGELIGPQSELYQENERKLPVANEYNRSYMRKLEIELPENYEIQNPEDIAITEVVKNDKGQPVFKFESKYEIKDGKLIVVIDEFYEKVYYPTSKFEAFRSVINAAADFNKIVLVLKQSS
ncbi:MAG: DUF3857 domain-containing protein [Fulvivirga sp.]|nr:DUF3857 domain-containing protein [Fulvivirga sp.]